MSVRTLQSEVDALGFCFEWRPFAEAAPGPGLFAVIDFGGDWQAMGPNDLLHFADALMAHSIRMRALAQRLVRMREVGP